MELFAEDPEYRLKRFRGPAFTVFGAFVLAYTAALALTISNRPEYVLISGAAVLSVVLIDLGIRIRHMIYDIVLFSAGGAIFAILATIIMLFFPEIYSITYAGIAVAGAFFLIKGIHDVHEIKSRYRQNSVHAKVYSR